MTARNPRSRGAREIASELVRLTAETSETIGHEPVTVNELRADLTRIDEVIQRLLAALSQESEHRPTKSHRDTLAVSRRVVEILALEEEWRRVQRRDTAQRRAELTDSLTRLRSLRTDQELVDQICAETCSACGADRALLAYIDANSWIPLRQFDSGAPHANAQPWSHASTQPLNRLATESAVVANRQSAQVSGGGSPTPPGPIATLMRNAPFVVAPIIVDLNVIGLLYAAEPTSSDWRHHDVAGRLATLAVSFGRLYERAATFRRLETQVSYLRDALAAASLLTTGLDTNVDLVQLVGRVQAGPTPAGATPWTTHRSTLDQAFTARERDVMALLAGGLDNAQIAQQLAIGTSTVKSHLQNMLRKAGAVNRAELIAQFYGSRPPQTG